MIEVLEEVAAVSGSEVIPRFETLHFEELDGKDVFLPVFDLCNPGQFLEIIRDRQVFELTQIEVDCLETCENVAEAANTSDDVVQVCYPVVICGVDLFNFTANRFSVLGQNRFLCEQVLDIENAAGLQHLEA